MANGKGNGAKAAAMKAKEGAEYKDKRPSVFHTILLIFSMILWCPLTGIPGMLSLSECTLL